MKVKGNIHSIETFGTVDGPGVRFVAFLQGCPLRCLFCHNPDTWSLHAKGQYQMTPHELLSEVLKYKDYIKSGGVTLSGGEPLMQPEFVLQFFKLCKQEGIHTALDTSGAVCNEAALAALDYVDLALLDIKTLNNELYPKLVKGTLSNSIQFLNVLQEKGISTWIRHVVVPGLTDDDEWLCKLAQYVSKYSVVKKIEILPYHTLGTYKYKQLNVLYALEGVEPLTVQRAKEIRNMLGKYILCE